MGCLELLEGCDYQESLPDSVTFSIRLFADDCLLYRTIKTAKDHQKLQADLEQLEIWAKGFHLIFLLLQLFALIWLSGSLLATCGFCLLFHIGVIYGGVCYVELCRKLLRI
jgi:hypothetical protein